MVFCRLADLLEVTVQLVHRDHHIFVQHRRYDVAYLFADKAEIAIINFQAQLVTVSDWKYW